MENHGKGRGLKKLVAPDAVVIYIFDFLKVRNPYAYNVKTTNFT